MHAFPFFLILPIPISIHLPCTRALRLTEYPTVELPADHHGRERPASESALLPRHLHLVRRVQAVTPHQRRRRVALLLQPRLQLRSADLQPVHTARQICT